MAAMKHHHEVALKNLKAKVRMLQEKEEHSRHQLRTALKKVSKLGKMYRNKLAAKILLMKDKLAEARASTYLKVAADLERKMLKNVASKSKALKAVIHELEKKHIAYLMKDYVRKGKKLSSIKKRHRFSSAKIIKTKSE